MNCMKTLLSIALFAGLSGASNADQLPVLWNVQVIAQTSAGSQRFAFSVPDGSCQSEVIQSGKGPQAALKVCMGNGLSAHSAYGWLVTDADMAALDGDKKYEHAQRFTVGTDGQTMQAENTLYSVTVSAVAKAADPRTKN